MPRGYAHEAMTGGDEPSLHLTVTMPTSDFTWAGCLKRDVRHHHRQAAECRQVIPLGDLTKISKDPAVKAQYEALMSDTLSACGFESARSLFQSQMDVQNREQRQYVIVSLFVSVCPQLTLLLQVPL